MHIVTLEAVNVFSCVSAAVTPNLLLLLCSASSSSFAVETGAGSRIGCVSSYGMWMDVAGKEGGMCLRTLRLSTSWSKQVAMHKLTE